MSGKSPVTEEEKNREQSIPEAISTASSIIGKEYLSDLHNLQVVEPIDDESDINVTQCGTFYHMKRLVRNKEEYFLDKLTTITNVIANTDSTLTTIIHSEGNVVEYYIGVVAKKHRTKNNADKRLRKAISSAFSGAVMGNFTGSTLEELSTDDIGAMHTKIFQKVGAISSISGIVAPRNREQKEFETYVQGIENLTHALRGKKYTIVLIADPIHPPQIQTIKTGYEMLYTQLSPFAVSAVTINEMEGVSVSETETTSVTKGITTGVSYTQSRGWNESIQKGKNKGWSAGVSIPAGPVGLSLGGMRGSSTGETKGKTGGTAQGRTQLQSEQESKQEGSTTGSSNQTGKSIQLNAENRSIKELLTKIDMHIERLEMCESFGAFDCAAYILTGNSSDSLAVACNYNALMRGEDSFIQSSYINSWEKPDDVAGEDTKNNYAYLQEYLRAFVHPKFQLQENPDVRVTPACQVSGKELALQFGLPKQSINGLTVLEMTPFGRNPLEPKDKKIGLGQLYFMGQPEETNVSLDMESLTGHTFVTGSTGAGKSNTIYHMLNSLMEENVHFMVVEPAKGEYKQVFGGRKDVTVYGTNPLKSELLRINPFAFPSDIHVLEHIDRLVEIFNACWPMYAAMPAVLKDAVEQAYIKCGWSLASSTCETGRVPSFRDLLTQLPVVMEQSSYSADTKGDYIGALVARVKSLTNGINGQVFCGEETISDADLFDCNVIVDLSRVGSTETKALLMGLLVMKLQEHRMCSEHMNASLHHITVLEEAHTLLRRTGSEQRQESSNLQGKSVEMLANAIAEMRTYGEGFIIADQSPGLLDLSVIRNTNTKIVMRLPNAEDRDLVGRTMGLQEEQLMELAKLERGVAAVYQNDWLEAVLCQVHHYKDKTPYVYQYVPKSEEAMDTKNALFQKLIHGTGQWDELLAENADDLKKWIFTLDAGVGAKNQLLVLLAPNGFVTKQKADHVIYCLLKGQEYCQLMNKIYPTEHIGPHMDQHIQERLQVSGDLIADIRDVFVAYVMDMLKKDNVEFVEKLQQLGGGRIC